MARVLGPISSPLGGLDRDEAALERDCSRLVASESRGANGEHEAEQMVRLGAKNGVGLRSCEVGQAGNFGDAAHIVARVEIERLNHLVRWNGHLGEELDAVGASTLVQSHDAIEQTVSPLSWREL